MHGDAPFHMDDILEAIAQLNEYTALMNYEAFARARKNKDAVVRNLEIIGEAAGRLPDFSKTSAPEIEWGKIVGLLCKFCHGNIYQKFLNFSLIDIISQIGHSFTVVDIIKEAELFTKELFIEIGAEHCLGIF